MRTEGNSEWNTLLLSHSTPERENSLGHLRGRDSPGTNSSSTLGLGRAQTTPAAPLHDSHPGHVHVADPGACSPADQEPAHTARSGPRPGPNRRPKPQKEVSGYLHLWPRCSITQHLGTGPADSPHNTDSGASHKPPQPPAWLTCYLESQVVSSR